MRTYEQRDFEINELTKEIEGGKRQILQLQELLAQRDIDLKKKAKEITQLQDKVLNAREQYFT